MVAHNAKVIEFPTEIDRDELHDRYASEKVQHTLEYQKGLIDAEEHTRRLDEVDDRMWHEVVLRTASKHTRELVAFYNDTTRDLMCEYLHAYRVGEISHAEWIEAKARVRDSHWICLEDIPEKLMKKYEHHGLTEAEAIDTTYRHRF